MKTEQDVPLSNFERWAVAVNAKALVTDQTTLATARATKRTRRKTITVKPC